MYDISDNKTCSENTQNYPLTAKLLIKGYLTVCIAKLIYIYMQSQCLSKKMKICV